MNVVAVIALCLIPLVCAFACIALLVRGFNVLYGALACLLGAVAVVPISLIQFFLGRTEFFASGALASLLVQTVVLNGIVEELFKMAVLFFVPSKNVSLSAFTAYSALSSLMLACVEALIYLVGGTHAFELRLVTAVVIHVCCGIMCGLFVYSARHSRWKWLPLVLAMLIHGVYDYFAMFPLKSPFFYFSIVVIAVSVVECRLRYRAIKNP